MKIYTINENIYVLQSLPHHLPVATNSSPQLFYCH